MGFGCCDAAVEVFPAEDREETLAKMATEVALFMSGNHGRIIMRDRLEHTTAARDAFGGLSCVGYWLREVSRHA
eukprot:5691932-Amphidinium_carterae.1